MSNNPKFNENEFTNNHEIKKLHDQLQKKDFIIERTKEYLFILENKNEILCKQIINLERDKTKLNDIIKKRDEEIKTLKEDMKK